MFCIFCGTKLPDVAKFCYSCGRSVADVRENNVENCEKLNSTAAANTSEAKTVLLKSTESEPASEAKTVLLKSAESEPVSETKTVLLKSADSEPASETKTVLLVNNDPPATNAAFGKVISRKKTTSERSSAQPKKPRRTSVGRIIIPAAIAVVCLASFVAVRYLGDRTSDLERAQVYLSENSYELAEEEFDKVIISNPSDENGYLGKAEALVAMGEIDEAIEVLSTGFRKTNSDKIWARLNELKSQKAESGGDNDI